MADALDLRIAQGPPVSDIGQRLGDLPKNYWEGLDEAYKRRNQNAFQDGIPKTPDGQPDWAAISQTILQKGGIPAVEPSVSTANVDIARQQLKLGQDISGQLGGLESPTGQAPIRVPQVGPGAQSLPPSTGPQPAQPQPSPTARIPGGDNGETTIMAAVGPHFADADAGRVALAVAQRLGVDPNAALPPEKFAQAQQLAQTAAQARRPQQPQAGPVPPAQMGAPPRGSQPTTQDPEIQQQIARYTQIMSNPALPATVRDAAKLRLEAITKNAEQTGPQKEYDLARRQGYEGTFQQFETDSATNKARATDAATRFGKKYDSISEAGRAAQAELPQIQLAQKLTRDPNFFSGSGEGWNIALKKMAVTLGADPNAAVPQEAVRKILSGQLGASVRTMFGGLGQVRVAELNVVKDANASLDNSPQALRMLLTMNERTHARNIAIAEMAQKYKNGNLDSGFDKAAADYDRKHPMFSDQEIADFRKVIIGKTSQPPPQPGDMHNGFRFKGGNPKDKNSWEPAA